MSDYQTLLFEQHESVAKITLNRPDAANAINLAMARDLMSAAIRCDEDPSVRAVLITATGKMFCAGGDIQSFGEAGDAIGTLVKEITAHLHAAISRFARMDAPVITAVNGAAAGAGFSLAIAADLALAAESARFTVAYTALGGSPDGSSSFFLPRLVGLRRAQELILTNRRLSAAEAAEWGLITRTVADEELDAESEKLAAKLAQGPTLAHGVVKKLLAGSFDQSLETQMELEARGLAETLNSPDGREGVDAFLNKRAAVFKGTR